MGLTPGAPLAVRKVIDGGANDLDKPFGVPIMAHGKVLLLGPLICLAAVTAWVLVMFAAILFLRVCPDNEDKRRSRQQAWDHMLSRPHSAPAVYAPLGSEPSSERRKGPRPSSASTPSQPDIRTTSSPQPGTTTELGTAPSISISSPLSRTQAPYSISSWVVSPSPPRKFGLFRRLRQARANQRLARIPSLQSLGRGVNLARPHQGPQSRSLSIPGPQAAALALPCPSPDHMAIRMPPFRSPGLFLPTRGQGLPPKAGSAASGRLSDPATRRGTLRAPTRPSIAFKS